MPVVVFKQIKPQRLREQAMRLALLNGQRKVGNEIKQDFEKTVRTWRRKPKFEVLLSQARGRLSVLIGTNDEVYAYVDRGTRPHLIFPRRAKALRFRGVYTAKTVPGVIDSREGGASGDEVFAAGVAHPGTAPRRFEETIARKWRTLYKRRMEQIMREVRQESGHAV
jgi:hypothetical protein